MLSMRLLNLLSPKIGASLDTLHYWLRPHERDTGGGDGGFTITERQRLNELVRVNREWRRSYNILRQTSVYFAKVECGRLWTK